MREMLVGTCSTNLRDLHRDVWRLASSTADRTAGRSFQFAVFPDTNQGRTRALIRGDHLPAQHSREMSPLVAGGIYEFRADIRAVSRSDRGEIDLTRQQAEEWVTRKLTGMSVQTLQCGPLQVRWLDTGHLKFRAIAGTVRIQDVEQATHVLRTGIGRSKAFGFGMVVLAHETID